MKLFPFFLRGVSAGSQLALVSIGYTLIYGVLGMINFAHGELLMLSGMALIFLCARLSVWLSVFLLFLLIPALALLVEKSAYRPLRKASETAPMISSIGISFLFQNLVGFMTGGLAQQYPEIPLLSQRVSFLGVSDRLSVFLSPVFALSAAYLLHRLIRKTKFGLAMRAVCHDFDTARLMGIRIDRVIAQSFGIAALLCAFSSLFWFSKNPGVTALSGTAVGLKAFLAAVIGGIGSIPGALTGGILIGVSESLLRGVGLGELSDVFTFGIFIFILGFRPQGIFGKTAREKL